MGETVRVRTARPRDGSAVAAVYVASSHAGFGGRLPPKTLSEELVARWRQEISAPQPKRWWLAEQDGRIRGRADMASSRDPVNPAWGELNAIVVNPPVGRRGIGRALMSLAVRHLAQDGHPSAIRWKLSGCERARPFYVATGRRPGEAVGHASQQAPWRYDFGQPGGDS